MTTKCLQISEAATRGVLKKRCSENMQRIYRRTPMPKYDFNKVAKQLYWNHTSAWCSPVNLLHIFRTSFPRNTSGWLLLKYHYSFLNFTIVFHYFQKTQFYLWLKEIWKAGCCFLISYTTGSSTHGYMMIYVHIVKFNIMYNSMSVYNF